MKLAFLDRKDEQARLRQALGADEPGLAVVYGRRRCGKSTLLQKVVQPGDVYFLADQREALLQIQAFATAVERVLPGFAAATYTSWDRLFTALAGRLRGRLNLFVDEFPYLVQSSPELPSIIQRLIDQPGSQSIGWVLCGSSQRMMQGAILDRTAPLFGRAQVILKIRPLPAGWITDALGVAAREAIAAYAVWGGVPRYWELARPYGSTAEALNALALNRNGVLHEEPQRLLQEDMRSAVQAYSLLSLIGSGCHRLSEIAARLEKPAGSLTRPLGMLIELGYVRKDSPWGENVRATKRTLHVIADPFLRFHFRFVLPNRSLLELGETTLTRRAVRDGMPAHIGGVWEELARESVPFLNIGGQRWRSAARWWGAGTDRQPLELDVVAESEDRKSILIGEAKWTRARPDVARLAADLAVRARKLPCIGKRSVVCALWLPEPDVDIAPDGVHVLGAADVLRVLR
ncbi:MAG: ATP-binding protein [Verrucomicrobia bacterium]|nr:ATP-binding protein [Verrucomicrobiota bacterium]